MDQIDEIIANASILANLAPYYEKWLPGISDRETEYKAHRYMRIRDRQLDLIDGR